MAAPQTEADLLTTAGEVSANALEKLVRSVQLVEAQDDAVKREDSQTFSMLTDIDGMVVIRGRLRSFRRNVQARDV